MPPTTIRRRVRFKQRVPRSARGHGRRTQRVLVAALLAVGLGAPVSLFLRAAVREGLADPARIARRFQVGAPVADAAPLLRLPAAPPAPAVPARAPAVPPRAAAVGWSTPAPAAVTRSWEAPFAGGTRTVAPAAPVTATAASAPVAPSGRTFTVTRVAPVAPLNPGQPALVAPAGLIAGASTAAATTTVSATGVERAPVSFLLAPTTGAAVIPGPRTRLVTPVPAAGPLPFVWSGAAVAEPSLGSNANWTNGFNWVNNAAPAPTASENIVYAAAPVAATATTVNANYTINSLTFQVGAPSYNVSSGGGSTLTVGAGGVADASANAQIVNVPVVLGAAQTWNVSNAAGLLSLPGGLTGTGGLTKTGAGTLSFDGSTISNFGPMAVTGGTLLLNKSESTLALNGNLAVGNAVNPGAVGSVVTRLLQSDQTGAGTSLTVYRDGLFDLTSPGGGEGVSSAFTTVNNVTMTGGEVRIGEGVLRVNGNVTTNASAASARITSTDFNSDINFPGGAHTFNVARGTAAYDLDVQAGITGGSLTKTGAGVLRLAGVGNPDLSVTLSAGTLAVADDDALGTTSGGGGGERRDGLRPSAYNPGLNYSTFNFAGGTLTADGADRTIGNFVSLTGSATIGASLDNTPHAFNFVNPLTVVNPATLTVNNNAATVFSSFVYLPNGGTFTVSGTGTTTISGQVADAQVDGTQLPGAIAKSGPGTLILSNNNTYTGGTTVVGGTLLATNTPAESFDSATGRGAVFVVDGARLGGTGSVGSFGSQFTPARGGLGNAPAVNSGDVVIGGILAAPSLLSAAVTPVNHAILGAGVNGAGILTINGNLTLTSSALLEVELGGTTAGAGGYDQLRVGGAIALGGDLSLALINGFAFTLGQTFYILDGRGEDALISGVFANVTAETATTGLFTDANGEVFRVNYAATDPADPTGPAGNDLSVTVLSVPEPGSLALAAAGLSAGVGAWVRRRRRCAV